VEEHLGRRIDDVLAHGQRLRPTLERVLLGDEPTMDMDYPLDLDDGAGTRYFRFACFPLGQGEHRLVGLVVADITASERAPRALAAGEARLRGIYESVQAGVVVQAPDGRLIHANRVAAEILGLPQEGLLGLTAAAPVWRMVDEGGAYVPPEEHPSMIALRTGQPVRGAVRGLYTGQPERLVWLLINAEPVTDPASGALLEVVVTFSDISAPVAAERALRESEARFRAVFEHAGSGMACVGLDGALLEVNPALAEMLGYLPEELVGLPLSSITHPEDLDADLLLYGELVAGACPDYQMEKRYLHRDGRVMWGRLTATLVRDAQGQPLFGLGSVVDVTAQHTAAEALAESEARYRTLFEQTANPILVIDTEGRYLEANQAALSFLETDRETLLTRTVRDLAPSREDAEAMLAQHAELWRTGGRADAEYVVHGRRKILDLTITLAQWRGRDVVFGVGRDVTEQRRLEERLREMNKLEAIGQLAGGVAHEFNNLLTVINGNAEMLADSLGNNHPGYHDAADILRAGSRAAGLVQQLLAFGRRQMVSVQVLDLGDVLANSTAMLRRMLPEQVLLDVALASDTGAVRGDPTQFDQIILALASNARDAMPDGGTLTVRTGNIAFDEGYINGPVALEPGSYVLLEVVDTGTGMSPEVIAHLFEPFFTTKEVGQGSGLGMAVVYGIVKQLGGEIEVESRVGRGARFCIYLPRVDAPPLQPLPLEMAATAPPAVLVVEDDPAVRRLAVRMLTDLGYRALEAVTAQQALELCHREKGRIALLLADVGMPGMSGPELARAMRPDCPRVPILYMTDYGAQAVEEEQPPTVRGVISKPFTRAQLGQWVEGIIGAGQPAPKRARP
jgi:PAS domain S-box-containing protein